MQRFYKLPISAVNVPVMLHVMRNGTKDISPEAKNMAKAILQVSNGTALVDAQLDRIDHDVKQTLSPHPEGERYIAILQGQLMVMIGDECPAMNPGEVWWLGKNEAVLINKSGDDVVLLHVVVKPE